MINTCLVPGCDGRMGTEVEVMKKDREKCNHIVGYRSYVGHNGHRVIYEQDINPESLSVPFKYCPMCGQRLKQK